MEVIQSNKGGLKLCHNGFMYTKHSTRKTKIWWKCTWRSSCQCRGSLITDLQRENPEVGQPHNHPADQSQVRLSKVRLTMKQQAAQTRDKPSQIFSQSVSQCDDAVKALLPTADSCKRTLRNQRPTPRALQRLADLGDLPREFTLTTGPTPENFLIYDNGNNRNDRILVFGTTASLRLFAAAETFYMDGNFAMAPNIFRQLYVIRVPFGRDVVTAVYALLPTKTRAVYEELFQALVDRCTDMDLQLNVRYVITDFEDAVLRAVVGVFGRDISSKGCFFHLTQATWRKIQELGLAVPYNANPDFRLFCGMLDGLAFLPLEDVQEGMQYLRTNVPADPPEAEDLLNYFDRTYVSGHYRQVQNQQMAPLNNVPMQPLRMRHVPPLFPPAVWNVHDATVNNDPRTNNVCEGWNNKFFNLVGHYHPSVWRSIEWFQREEATVSTLMQQDAVGTQTHKRVKQRYVLMQERLRNLCADCRAGRKTVREMLRGVGWNIRQTMRNLH